MTYPTVPVFTTGELVEASDWNTIPTDLTAMLGAQWFEIDGSALRPDLTNGCDAPSDQTTTGGNPLLSGPGFSGSADKFAQFKIALPKRWNAGTVTFRIRWNSPNAGAGDVVWSLAGVAASDGDSIDASFGSAQTVTDTFQGVKKHHKTSISSAITIAGTPAKEDNIYFRFGRLATNGSDTKAEVVYVEAVEVFITPDTVNDA